MMRNKVILLSLESFKIYSTGVNMDHKQISHVSISFNGFQRDNEPRLVHCDKSQYEEP